jgi:hypothetical protein
MIEVEAAEITDRKIFYNCPFCFTNNKRDRTFDSPFLKNGRRGKNRVPTRHHHGNEMQTVIGNWETHRTSHCSVNSECILIKITDNTKRI